MSGTRRSAFVLIDGLGDVSLAILGGRTPLEEAATPCMDQLATYGLNGLMDPVEPGVACGSDTAHLSLLGYDPHIYYHGRGAFEAMGSGLSMKPGDIAFKSNFATLDVATGVVLLRRADRNFTEEGPMLCRALDGCQLPSFPQYEVAVKYATEHRCGVRIRGPGLSDATTGTDPLKDNLPLLRAKPLNDSPEAVHTASLVNELCDVMRRILEHHPINLVRKEKGLPPANVVLLRGCGARLEVPSFPERYGLRSFMIAPTAIIRGLGMSLGFEIITAEGGTGDCHTNLHSKALTCLHYLVDGEYDFGFLHIKAVDDAGHDKNVQLKVNLLEKIDRALHILVTGLQRAQREGKGEFNVIVTGDHSTPVQIGDHSYEPVPFLICPMENLEPGGDPLPFPPDSVHVFSEIEAHRGSLGRFPGSQVMTIVKHYTQMR